MNMLWCCVYYSLGPLVNPSNVGHILNIVLISSIGEKWQIQLWVRGENRSGSGYSPMAENKVRDQLAVQISLLNPGAGLVSSESERQVSC